jgi:hypothetical protein
MNDLVTLTESLGEAAGVLLATRHARERARFPLLPAEYEDPVRAVELVREVLDFCEGVAVLDEGGALAGFLTSFESKPDPRSPMARYAPEHASVHLVHGHAIALDADPAATYASMFSELAPARSTGVSSTTLSTCRSATHRRRWRGSRSGSAGSRPSRSVT